MAKTRTIAVRNWMTRRVVSIHPDARLSEAAALMRARKLRHLPVVDRDGRLVGIVSTRDLRQALFAPSVNLRDVLDTLVVRDVMTRGVVSVRAVTSIREAARVMHEHKIGALPVVESDRLVGMLTESDVLDGFQRMLGATATSA